MIIQGKFTIADETVEKLLKENIKGLSQEEADIAILEMKERVRNEVFEVNLDEMLGPFIPMAFSMIASQMIQNKNKEQ